ncbi:MAG: helix-turn-helix domain-containing protein [Lachnospiraceae bacterium]|nr:helix-turn-helix domain-containing protein [Lachnospiraceae bacterium]
MKKTTKKTKSRIVSAAWKLFYEQGYDATTIEEIVEESHTSRGSFYHYFEGKDALLGSLSYMFDEKYEELEDELAQRGEGSVETLAFLNHELFEMIETSIDFELLCRLLASQLTTSGEKHLLDRNRTYYRLLRKIVREGQQRGEITRRFSVNELVKHYALCERGMMYDWCLSRAEYSLTEYADTFMPGFLKTFRAEEREEGPRAERPGAASKL